MMKDYVIEGREPHLTVCLGWDPSLSTYFAQVVDERGDWGVDAELLWVGDAAGEVATVDDLAARLAPFVTLTEGLREQLARDRIGEPERTTAARK